MKKKNTKIDNNAIDTVEMFTALDDLEKENGINKDELMKSIEQALVLAYNKNFGTEEGNVDIILDKTDGQIHVFQKKEVVKKVEDDKKEIKLSDAKKINDDYDIGDTVQIEVMPKNFGRIAAQTAKQVITQKIREMSRDVIFNEFEQKKGEIVTGLIQKVDKNSVVLDLGKVEAIMPAKEQVATEKYNMNDKLKTCIVSVEKGYKGSTQIVVSRANVLFVKNLFKIEIPEIYEGLIEIKSISREAGSRSKVAVYSANPNIDPVGSCVGQKGIRIQNIINELHGEKIDVIEWNPDISTFIASALLPAKIMAVDIKEEDRFAQVIVADDQLSLAIGKAGQNARLAAKLTNWKIDIKSESQFREYLASMSDSEDSEEDMENVEEGE